MDRAPIYIMNEERCNILIQKVASGNARRRPRREEEAGRSEMLRMTVNTEEYIQIGDDIRIVFLGGSRNHTRVMLDVPKEINVVRSRALENHAKTAEDREKISHYHAVPELEEKYRKKKIVVNDGARAASR